MIMIEEPEFRQRFYEVLSSYNLDEFGCVTGPGRSGALASVYASHFLHLPFIPFGEDAPDIGRLLIVDTATDSGRTLRKAERNYAYACPFSIVAFHEPPRVIFWYEKPKAQIFNHEKKPLLVPGKSV